MPVTTLKQVAEGVAQCDVIALQERGIVNVTVYDLCRHSVGITTIGSGIHRTVVQHVEAIVNLIRIHVGHTCHDVVEDVIVEACAE